MLYNFLVAVVILSVLLIISSIVRLLCPPGMSGKRESAVWRDAEGRTLFGKPLKTQDDWERWWVLKGLANSYYLRLRELEHKFSDHSHPDPASLLTEWRQRYISYKSLCAQHGMWNSLLGDCTPYIPTEDQLRLEKALLQNIENLYNSCMEERKMYICCRDQIFDFLLAQPRHKVVRKILFRHFADEDPVRNKQFRRMFRQLVNNKVLTERKNKDGNYYVRKAPSARQKPLPSIKPSAYSASMFASVDKRLLYKVEYTVTAPLNVDVSANTCTFTSKSSGEQYRTSLEECTCPAFDPAYPRPCKHMLALALHLGYISKADARFR